MQGLNQALKIESSRKVIYCKNIVLLTLTILPLISFTFYPSPIALGQEKLQNSISNEILICQVMEYIESPIGSNMQQVSNICSYQDSIGHNQSKAELCFIFSGNNIDIINAFCDKAILNQVSIPPTAVNETSTLSPPPTAVNETNETLNSQSTTDNGLRVTIFDGVSNFFSDIFNP
jgi:hypothetical protein